MAVPTARTHRPKLRREPPAIACEGARALRAWRKAHDVSQGALEEILGTANHYVHEWEFGVKIPTLPYAAHIEVVTEGSVRVESWGYTARDVDILTAFAARRGVAGPVSERRDPGGPVAPRPLILGPGRTGPSEGR